VSMSLEVGLDVSIDQSIRLVDAFRMRCRHQK
jgi:hypothetical protein